MLDSSSLQPEDCANLVQQAKLGSKDMSHPGV